MNQQQAQTVIGQAQQIKSTLDVPRREYQYVPVQDFNESWDDKKLILKYGLTEDEVKFINSMIKPLNLSKNTEVDE